MKIIRKSRPVRGKRAKQVTTAREREPTLIKQELQDTFEHPFRVHREDDQTRIEWDCGPRRENVWGHLIFTFPQFAAEAMMDMIWKNGCDIQDEHLSIPIPFSVKRLDLFNAPIAAIPRLVAAGAELEEEGDDGTPLLCAVRRGIDPRAVALAQAGACLDEYSPGGRFWSLACDLPVFVALVEARLLSAATQLAEPPSRPAHRL